MKLKLGFSTCPNDTYIFDAIVNKRINLEGISFEVVLADVEELNTMAFELIPDVTKLSFHAYAYVSDYYKILNTGSALGYKNGPLLISKKKIYPDEVSDLIIAVPGKYTTANLLLGIAYPDVKKKKEYLFSNIEDVVLSGETDAGLIIHESRFTYTSKGLKKIIDLGEYWEEKTHLPIPLGGIMIRRDLPEEIRKKVNHILKASISYAKENPRDSFDYIKMHAQSVEDEVIRKHIDLYVNE
ncbi:MAG: 1,4-dihydroxy-6-naphthoate synthase, partial [Bacteroidales bacterium]|nr:1,4-dihydroxy-6-naphthoate synthase [Bacteroidales bacterium]